MVGIPEVIGMFTYCSHPFYVTPNLIWFSLLMEDILVKKVSTAKDITTKK